MGGRCRGVVACGWAWRAGAAAEGPIQCGGMIPTDEGGGRVGSK